MTWIQPELSALQKYPVQIPVQIFWVSAMTLWVCELICWVSELIYWVYELIYCVTLTRWLF